MSKVILPTDEDLRRLRYEPETGHFRWCEAGRGVRVGSVAGSKTCYGYWQIKLNHRIYLAHRLAWFIATGEWSSKEIDHINGIRTDNRISNLREVNRSENMQNLGAAHSDNKTCGLLGVTWNKQHKRWQSKLQANKRIHHVGYFDTAEEAHQAYLLLKKQLHPTFARGGCH